MHTTCSITKQGVPLKPLDLELEKAVRRRRRQHRDKMNEREDERNLPPRQQAPQQGQNGQRTMRDYVSPNIQSDQNPIVRPAVTANNFEIKPAMIQMIQNL